MIIFGSTIGNLCQFFMLMHSEFEMSMVRELKFFMRIQIHQNPKGVLIHKTKYTRELLEKFKMNDYKPMPTPMRPTCSLNKDESGKKVDQKQSSMYRLEGFCDTDYVGDILEGKSISKNCTFLGDNLISLSKKKNKTLLLYLQQKHNVFQQLVCNSQLLWMNHKLEDFKIYKSNIPIFCDNTSII